MGEITKAIPCEPWWLCSGKKKLMEKDVVRFVDEKMFDIRLICLM